MRPAQAKQKLYIERKEWNAKGYIKKNGRSCGNIHKYLTFEQSKGQ